MTGTGYEKGDGWGGRVLMSVNDQSLVNHCFLVSFFQHLMEKTVICFLMCVKIFFLVFEKFLLKH
ncbi:MAG: hypothetical protein C4518_02280 [Desulfobacteraceae bacterium]|nr:MAG: hypothetical protein C4518_02280 [Desulfobacteraceae bacterium]